MCKKPAPKRHDEESRPGRHIAVRWKWGWNEKKGKAWEGVDHYSDVASWTVQGWPQGKTPSTNENRMRRRLRGWGREWGYAQILRRKVPILTRKTRTPEFARPTYTLTARCFLLVLHLEK